MWDDPIKVGNCSQCAHKLTGNFIPGNQGVLPYTIAIE